MELAVRQASALASFRHAGREISLRVFGHRSGRHAEKTGLPLIVYFHGGYFDCGRADDADGIAAALADSAIVVTVDYPLAPTMQFPDTAELAFAALLWAREHADAYGADGKRMFVAGDQAGGNLAAAAAMMARDRVMPNGRSIRLKGQVLITPMLDPHQTSSSMHASGECICREGWAAYLPAVGDALHPYAAPSQSRRLADLAPALIVSTESDAMRDEAEQYATRLIVAGVPVHMRRLEGSSRRLLQPDHPDFPIIVATVSQFINDPG
ncbi:alpha/beta hydrolase fold domain-containing protein [Oxalicibacterium solurbis]|uniref:Carboxylesterase n=1 Tax=Oxalicibacterium solurbis TaxID=69280 RepID=A0A8J3F7Y4_9BURK|nr:alpha/beta hydrolase fold domain-containing protein [Oxalicibacterium solurbis]GGI52923.1 carboxylesterase [Oxalicibacterium solurbis]